jgi:hypothetical protein
MCLERSGRGPNSAAFYEVDDDVEIRTSRIVMRLQLCHQTRRPYSLTAVESLN